MMVRISFSFTSSVLTWNIGRVIDGWVYANDPHPFPPQIFGKGMTRKRRWARRICYSKFVVVSGSELLLSSHWFRSRVVGERNVESTLRMGEAWLKEGGPGRGMGGFHFHFFFLFTGRQDWCDYSSDLTFPLPLEPGPGWTFIESEDWRVDLQAGCWRWWWCAFPFLFFASSVLTWNYRWVGVFEWPGAFMFSSLWKINPG
jgi:hypothetical protein